MVWIKRLNTADLGDSTHVGGDQWDTMDKYHDNIDIGGTTKINTSTYYRSGKLGFRNPADTFSLNHVVPAILADRNINWPLLGADDAPVMAVHPTTLSGKDIQIQANTLGLKDLTARIMKVGSTYYAIKWDGSTISSGATFETVAQAGIDELPGGDILFGNGDGLNLEFLISTTGLNITDQFEGTNLILLKNTNIVVPNGYTGNAIHWHNAAYSNLDLYGYIYEAGTPGRNWTGILMEADNDDSVVYNVLNWNGGMIYDCNNVIELKANGPTGFVNGNIFNHPVAQNFITFCNFNSISGGPISGNHFNSPLIQCAEYSEFGFKNVPMQQYVSNVRTWDTPPGYVPISIAASGDFGSQDGFVSVGGNLQYDIAFDDTTNTQIFDGWWTILGNNLHIFANKTMPQITANQNNYALGDDVSRILFFVSSNASWNITGLSNNDNTYGRVIILYNHGTQNIVLKNEDANSTTTNRFHLEADLTLGPKQSVTLYYDGEINSRWILFGKNTIGVGGGDALLGTAQTFTAVKTFDNYMDLKAISVPGSPSSGYIRFFIDTADGKIKIKRSNGDVVIIE